MGMVYLVGAGPGDPGLITVRGAECLGRAQVVVYDYLANPALLDHAPPGAERVQVGKHGAGRTLSQEQINALLIDRARAGKAVVRLKGGDPFIFGRGGEEAQALAAASIPWEVVPGITAAVAVPAYAGIPLTHRDFAATVVLATGHESWDKEYTAIDWQALAKAQATVVLYMSVRRLEQNIARLLSEGRSPETPAALIEWGTLPHQRVVTAPLGQLVAAAAAAGLAPPALLVVGRVVTLRAELAWLERRPLYGKRVLIARARAQSKELVAQIRELGGEVVALPTLSFVPPDSLAPLDEALVRLGAYDWVVFTSQNAVSAVFERLASAHRDARAFGPARVCAIGSETARALADRGIVADIVPDEAMAEGLVKVFAAEEVESQRVLLPRAAEARDTLPEALRLRGAQVDVVAAYRTVRTKPGEAPAALEQIQRGGLDIALFASPSQVAGFFELTDGAAARLLAECQVVGAIGPVTAEALTRRGVRVDIVPRQHTAAALVEAVLKILDEKGKR